MRHRKQFAQHFQVKFHKINLQKIEKRYNQILERSQHCSLATSILTKALSRYKMHVAKIRALDRWKRWGSRNIPGRIEQLIEDNDENRTNFFEEFSVISSEPAFLFFLFLFLYAPAGISSTPKKECSAIQFLTKSGEAVHKCDLPPWKEGRF
uniref:Uncharacterized protein n=1 Tax=Megaselia scalaris TaxID=36166 RepID=T1GQT2_MEGSC